MDEDRARGGLWRAVVRVQVLGLLLAGLLAATTPAHAHSEIHHVWPENGSVLEDSPPQLEVMFDEAPQPGAFQFGIAAAADEQPLDLPDPLVDGTVAIQPLPALPEGAYSVGFRMLAGDGHVVQGVFGFSVGAPGTAVATPDGAAAVAPAVADSEAAMDDDGGPFSVERWLVGIGGLSVVVAVLAFRRHRRA
jgi:methionine-rich copper-binding protein CopC